ncbi:MAG: radical SAM protein, partial [Candidatus Thermoplasmatota archaeon]
MLIKESSVKKGLPKKITSICPECKKLIEATLRAKDGKVVIEKKCSLHGEFNDIVWSDVEMYLKAEKYASDGIGVENPKIKDAKLCPQDCGLCNLHLTHTALAVLDLTNRCNLMCPVCFANANASGYVYEPSMEMVVRMMENLRNNRPVPTPSIQFSGGEPTLHKNFLDIVKKAEELGFAQIQVATNGIKFADEEDFAQKCVDAGLDTIYLQFDGLDDDIYISMRGKKLLNKKIKAIENIRKTEPLKMSVCLVPTIINSVNDNQIGDIINFAIKNIDVVHAVNFQPVAFEGRISQEERLKKRFTLPDLVKRIEEQVGYLKRDDFYTVPFS